MEGQKQSEIKKILSLFAAMRSYNLLIVVLAQYLSAIFIFGEDRKAIQVMSDTKLFLLVCSSSLAIASGYLINNFYDRKKDVINRPITTYLASQVSRETRLRVYFTLNFISVVLALFISFRAALFYAVYIFLLWFYSHKLKKYPIIGNLTAAFLAILPFFGILFYFKNFSFEIFLFGLALYIVLLVKELVKDLENLPGDFVNKYRTIAVVHGEKFSKNIVIGLLAIQLFMSFYLVKTFDMGLMKYYFYFSMIMAFLLAIMVFKSSSKRQFVLLHILIKFWLVMGVLSIVLLNPSVVLEGKKIMDEILP